MPRLFFHRPGTLARQLGGVMELIPSAARGALSPPAPPLPAVAVLGPYRSGTSCTAGMLAHLGVHLGGCLRWPGRDNPTGFWESRRLARLCWRTFEEPELTLSPHAEARSRRVARLRRWCESRRRQVPASCPAVAGKHPLLCLMGPELEEAWRTGGQEVRWIAVDRPVEESLASMKKLDYWGWSPPVAAAALNHLIQTRDAFLAERAHLRVDYRNLIEQPAGEVDRVCEYLDLPVTDRQRHDAVTFVDPSLQRSSGGTG